MQPLVEELPETLLPSEALNALQDWPGVVLFDSALTRDRLGRFSFLTADPFASFEVETVIPGSDPFAAVRRTMTRFDVETMPDLPPFQGGAAGVLSYELGTCWERVRRARFNEFQFPDAAIGVFDWVIAWDHSTRRVWLVSQGLPEIDLERRRDRAAARIKQVKDCLTTAQTSPRSGQQRPAGTTANRPRLPIQAPQYELPGYPHVSSNFSPSDYQRAVARVVEYIHAGDIFQANLSQRLLASWEKSPVELYQILRERNPAPFAGFVSHRDWALVSASPERFVRLHDREVETRPIKGTRQRRSAPEADLYARDELRESEKDVAENVMIVDLLRNDLSRVCEPGSITVPQLCVVETYETVQHLVSEIRGRLARQPLYQSSGPAPGVPGGSDVMPIDEWSLLAAVFPGGSITGAPKIRAMEIIAELEPTVRGPYCGSLFYSGFDGRMDSSILIRSFLWKNGVVQFPVGGGIVAQSDPVDEYQETLHKAEGMLRALTQ